MRATRICLFALVILMSSTLIRALVVRVPSVQRRSRIARLFQHNVPRRRQRRVADTSGTPSTLEWNSFEFGQSPKLDARFNDDSRQVFDLSEDEIEEFAESETKKDEMAAKRLNRQSDFVNLLTPKVVEHATRALVPFLQENRLERIDDVLSKRTRNCRFLFENPANPSNVWACLRTIDSFGIQNIDLIVDSPRYQGKAALAQKRGMRTAMGSAQWLTLRNYASTKQAVEDIKSQGYRLYASDLNPNSRDIRDIDWTQEARPICIVMGNENDGISEEMRNMADETFTLPMSGFAESFNLSVATAITLAHLSACSKDSKGPLRPGDMTQHEVNCLRLRGILNSLAHKKLGKAVLKKEGIELPKELGWIH